MGIFLGGKHEGAIDEALEFLQLYLKTEGGVELSKINTAYFTLKFSMLKMLEDESWREILDEVAQEVKLDEAEFMEKLEQILNKFREKIREKIKEEGVSHVDSSETERGD
ncbi:MAG: hypothetical protein ACTSPB_03030 [Candidatus Thorarchaeota archaeon]